MNNGAPHNGGEMWAQTLWDLRTRGRPRRRAGADHRRHAAVALDDPSMLDMRDAILQQALAMRTAPGAPDDHFAEVWEVFRARGMGFDATTDRPADTAPDRGLQRAVERALRPASRRARPLPGRRQRRHFEPGERIQVSAPVYSAGLTDLPGVTGTLTLPDGDDRGRHRGLAAAGQGAHGRQRRPARGADARRLRRRTCR